MPDYRLSFYVEKPYASLVDEEWLEYVTVTTLVTAGVPPPVEISLVIAGDHTVQNLNRTYRGVNRTTDVLAFALSEQGHGDDERFVVPPGEAEHLGEVVVSYQQAVRQAEEQAHPLNSELALLIAHGVLHLLGYDHEDPPDKRKMRAMEAKILDAIEKGRKA